jgi:two-component system response regulator PilR (NtrC family)
VGTGAVAVAPAPTTPAAVTTAASASPVLASPSTSAASASPFDLEKGVEDFERAHILQALEKANGVKKKAAHFLGISFRSLRYRIEKYGISDPNPEENE